ncbi:hypothetical protein FERRO_13230 [Ferrovum sp. JA12]|uniref:thiol-disulfide oxidoreductase DCC family protein n=1 Tax=Ferrovum sp. JA12 TaxID=1356299 RepID=UPI00070287F8|nr:DUF393 domain-containing protein [Ferrovum sp. JA12]KRH78339.1 hypothetical protein FERRO_13230 [Ferrovum sp. JA12]
MPSTELRRLTLFYDGACALCQAEILFLSSRNQEGLLDFVDVQSTHYDPIQTGVSCAAALSAMYAQYDDGEMIHGVRVFPEAYRRAQLPLLAWLFSRQLLQPLFKVGYYFFAKNRHGISKILGPTTLWLVRKKTAKHNLS